MIVCRITTADNWAAALARGVLPIDPDGFVHLSTPDQVAGTVERYYADESELVVLDIDTDQLPANALRWENDFPHLYAPLPVDAVVGVRDLAQ